MTISTTETTLPPPQFRLVEYFPRLLLVLAISEMVVYRLLVPGLRPKLGVTPPLWHSALSYCGLFLFYFASMLAVAVVAYQVWQIYVAKDRKFAWLIFPFAMPLLAFSGTSILITPSAQMSFLLEATFVASCVVTVLVTLFRRGDWGIRIGLVTLALPLVVHFYAPFSTRYIGGEEALWNGLSDSVEHTGRWLVLLAALAMPYCFAARPFILQAARLPPLLIAFIVGTMGSIVVRHNYSKGMELAQNGLGWSIGPTPPSSLVALCLLSGTALVWTLANTLLAPTRSRQNIGVGIGLVVVAGYAFAWPLQFLLGLSGLLAIASNAARVRVEEWYDVEK